MLVQQIGNNVKVTANANELHVTISGAWLSQAVGLLAGIGLGAMSFDEGNTFVQAAGHAGLGYLAGNATVAFIARRQ